MTRFEVVGWDAVKSGVAWLSVFVATNHRNVGTCRHNSAEQARRHVETFARRPLPRIEAKK